MTNFIDSNLRIVSIEIRAWNHDLEDYGQDWSGEFFEEKIAAHGVNIAGIAEPFVKVDDMRDVTDYINDYIADYFHDDGEYAGEHIDITELDADELGLDAEDLELLANA